MTKNLQSYYIKKDRLYKRYITTGSPNLKANYQKLRNVHFNTINYKKKEYFKQKFIKFKNNIKKSWQCINYLIGKNKQQRPEKLELNTNDKSVTDPVEIANIFNDCFTNTTQLLLKNLPQTTVSHHNFFGTSNPTSIFFYPTTTFKLSRLISETPSKFSAGWDGIPSILLKYLPINAFSALSYVFNLSLSQGKFITFFKHAKVNPIFKKENTKNVANYRPISLLSNFSKILEKIVHRRLYSFFNNSNLLSNYQFGFRQLHLHLIILFTDKVTIVFENKQSTLEIFLDFSKAFDIIDHKILLNKLYHYGVRGTPFSWFKSYLTDRTQQTEVLGTKSTNINKLTSSVPQGSILGPILFIIYVNDFPKCLRYSSCLAFADDTTILISGKNKKTCMTMQMKSLITSTTG